MKRARYLVALCLLAAMLPVAMVGAQEILGTVQGRITGDNGEPLPGVTVTVRNQQTGIERTVMTDANGRYIARSLASGVYSITAALEGMQTTRQEDVRVLIGQTIDVNLQMQVESTTEVITVTAEAPLIEVSRSSAANYVDEVAIESLPISGRDFTNFALLTPTVQVDRSRGFLTMSGQRGIYTGLSVDGADNKSTFFGYGRGGEATENDGLVVAQDSVKEFQVVTSEFSPEFGRSGGSAINVVTKSGTNELKGSAFLQLRDDSLAEDLPSSPLDGARGVAGGRPVDEFEREDFGVSIGGPIARDRTHFFFAYDDVSRDDPFSIDLDTPTNWSGCGEPGSTNCLSTYDAVLRRAQTEPGFAALVDGYTRRPDGSAAGNWLRTINNQILFGKVDHQFNPSHQGSIRVNYTDFERLSTYLDEESSKLEDTTSIIGSLVSVLGPRGVNEFRFQFAEDNLDRLSQRVGQAVEAEVEFRFGDFDQVGKFDFLPIFVEESQLQVKDDVSYLFGEHDVKFGVDYSSDDLKQLFAGSLDGRYRFRSVDDFLANNALEARIYFGNVNFPNYDETQDSLAIYAQDSWKRGNLTVNFGVRYEKESNPDNLQHFFPQARDIPDPDGIAPRVGFAWSPNGTDVVRGGLGVFFGRTPTLLFASQVQENGIFPNFGRITVDPDETGYVPLGTQIDNFNPPAGTIPSIGFVSPQWELGETTRFNLGYERTLGATWSAGVDVLYAEGENLQRNLDTNRTIERRDEFGRAIYARNRPDSNFDEVLVRSSLGESEYTAVTLKVNKRFDGRYTLGAHYTWSEDKDDDSNERSATGVTITDTGNLRYDWGLSDRDVENRFLVYGTVQLPLEFKIGGVLENRSGYPWTALDSAFNPHNYPDFDGPLGFGNGRAIIGGQLVGRNTFRNESITTLDVRASKFFTFSRYRVDVYIQGFNLLDENSFGVAEGQREPDDSEFGIASFLTTTPRQYELGARFSF